MAAAAKWQRINIDRNMIVSHESIIEPIDDDHPDVDMMGWADLHEIKATEEWKAEPSVMNAQETQMLHNFIKHVIAPRGKQTAVFGCGTCVVIIDNDKKLKKLPPFHGFARENSGWKLPLHLFARDRGKADLKRQLYCNQVRYDIAVEDASDKKRTLIDTAFVVLDVLGYAAPGDLLGNCMVIELWFNEELSVAGYLCWMYKFDRSSALVAITEHALNADCSVDNLRRVAAKARECYNFDYVAPMMPVFIAGD